MLALPLHHGPPPPPFELRHPSWPAAAGRPGPALRKQFGLLAESSGWLPRVACEFAGMEIARLAVIAGGTLNNLRNFC